MSKTLFLFLIAIASFAAPTPKSKLSPDAAAVAGDKSVQVIIQWNIKTGMTTQTKVAAAGGTVVSEFKSINAGTYILPASSLAGLISDSSVVYLSVDRAIHHKFLDNSAAAVNASAAWSGSWTGSGVGVAVIDSGITASPSLNNIAFVMDFTGKTGKKAGNDQFGHGQHVAGIIASNGAASSGTPSDPVTGYTRLFKGIAPDVTLVNLRVLDENGDGSDSMVIAAIDEAISLKSTYNIGVLNLSLGRPVYESYLFDPLCQAVEAAWRAGIVVVVAAGNDGRDNSFGTQGYGTITAPGNDPYVITVGAMKTEGTPNRSDDLIASYSSKGPTQIDHIVKPDLVAPGNRVVSLLADKATLAANYPANAVSNSYYETYTGGHGTKASTDYFQLSGTSMAAPVVTGAAADLLQANPKLTPDQIKALLMSTAYKSFPASSTVTDSTGTYTDYYDIFTVGAGYVDLGAALAALSKAPASAPALSPVASYVANSGVVTLSFGALSIFANRCVWGTSQLDSANRAIWGTQAVWGTSESTSSQNVSGARAVWGTDSVYSSSAVASESATLSIQGEP
jgi:serine protease AprX